MAIARKEKHRHFKSSSKNKKKLLLNPETVRFVSITGYWRYIL